jgi:hypothetical protein
MQPNEPKISSRSAPPRGSNAERASPRRLYEPPRVEVLGDVRDITLGGSPGIADSTPPNTQTF